MSNVTLVERARWRLLFCSIERNEISQVRDLIQSRLLDRPNRSTDGAVALFAGARGGRFEICKILIEAGVGVNAMALGRTMLSGAIFGGHMHVCMLLLKQGADIDAKDAHGNRAIHHAVESENEEICAELLARGVDISVTNKYGNQPLTIAVQRGLRSMVKLLLRHGADVNHKAAQQMTALHYAATLSTASPCNAVDLCRLLVVYGADRSIPAELAHCGARSIMVTPFQFAVMRGHPTVVHYFVMECEEDLGQRNACGSTLRQLVSQSSGGMKHVLGSLKRELDNHHLAVKETLSRLAQVQDVAASA